jgi:hypothetical protein
MEVNGVGREEKCMQGGEKLIRLARAGVWGGGIKVWSLVRYALLCKKVYLKTLKEIQPTNLVAYWYKFSDVYTYGKVKAENFNLSFRSLVARKLKCITPNDVRLYNRRYIIDNF